MAVESLFPLDLAVDLCVLAAVQQALDRPCLRRLLRTQLALSVFTLLCISLSVSGAAAQIIACPLASFSLLGRRRLSIILEGAAGIFCAYAATAGFAQLAGRGAVLCPLGLFAFSLLLRKRRHIRFNWNIELRLTAAGVQIGFPALIDTGNRLRDHKSGLPVLIIEEDLLQEILPALDPDKCRFLPYGVLGSTGEILCFTPEFLRIRGTDGIFRPAPECLIASFPGKIPGRIRALAPPEFAGCAEQHARLSAAVQNTLRRFHYGVFKRKTIHLRPGCTASPRLGMLHRRQ